MGREIPRSEHNIPGRVWVSRPMPPRDFELPPDLQEAREAAHARIRHIKILADPESVGHIALIQAEGLPTGKPEAPSLENFRLQ